MITALLKTLLLIPLALFQLVGPVPADLGVHHGALSPCPTPAHCASAIWRSANPTGTLDQLATLVAATPRTVVVERANGYLHATASSRIFGFVDDLELYADPDHGVVQARSISRLGDSDLGVNRRRLNALAAVLKD